MSFKDLQVEAESNTTNDSPIIVGLDIGTTKVVAIAGRKNEFGKLEIVGFGRANSSGVLHGQVLNIDETIRAINTALNNCLKSNPALEINEVYVGIAGHHIKSLQTRGDLVRQNSEIEVQQYEIDILIENQKKTFIPAGDEIIDVIPQDFCVDNRNGIKHPVGYMGVRIGANFHIITGDKNAIRNINRAVERSNLHTKDLVLQPLASASAVMDTNYLDAGVAILDIGGGTSDLAIFHEGILKHTAVIPFGGENITEDIKKGLGVMKSQAEAMKVQFGSAIAEQVKANSFINIPPMRGLPGRDISVKNLAMIINARMSEILDFVAYQIKSVKMDARALNGGIILTGGGSQLKHLIQLTEYTTGLNARIGLPNEHLAPNHIDELKKPMYATCIGLILKGFNDYEKENKSFDQQFNKIKVTQSPFIHPQQPSTTEVTQVEGPVNIDQRAKDLQTKNELEEEKVEKQKRGEKKAGFWDRIKGGFINFLNDNEDPSL